MPQETRALTRAARARMAVTGQKYTDARESVLAIRELMDDNEWTYAEAEAWLDDPANQVMCEVCGWTNGMACPECPGCGCYSGRCTGWRHREADAGLEPEEGSYCTECGANSRYECSCAPCPECGADGYHYVCNCA